MFQDYKSDEELKISKENSANYFFLKNSIYLSSENYFSQNLKCSDFSFSEGFKHGIYEKGSCGHIE